MWREEQALVRRRKKSAVIAQRDFGVRFNYIAGEFKPGHYHAEPVDLLRKLFLTGFLSIMNGLYYMERVVANAASTAGFRGS